MKILKLGTALFAVAFFLFACTQDQATKSNIANNIAANAANSQAATPAANAAAVAAATPDELAEARRIYSTTCVKCHKEDGKGGVTDIEGTKIKAPDFTSDRMKKEPDEEFIEVIQNGEKGDGMPAFKGKISDDEIKNLVRFIRREFQGK